MTQTRATLIAATRATLSDDIAQLALDVDELVKFHGTHPKEPTHLTRLAMRAQDLALSAADLARHAAFLDGLTREHPTDRHSAPQTAPSPADDCG